MTDTDRSLKLYNTLSRDKQDFVPLEPNRVRMYVCGPTVYDYAHIGNARPVVVFDVLFRLLRTLYGEVIYARNITDIDDKIIEAAGRNNESIESVTARTTAAFHDDMAALGALPPGIEPRATAHIEAMLDMITALIDKGHAYTGDGHVLFHVPSMPDYGGLSRRDRGEMIAGARVEIAPYKKDPADFVLWKPSTPDQPGWDSPWGRGRPGWHIECSAMSAVHLGPTFDIHGGGLDLIFPHHENEIAQSRCAHGAVEMARFWLHNGYVTVGGEKMSKSLGNFVTVRELLDRGWPGEVIRLTLLSAQYRQPLDFTETKLAESRAQLDRLYGALRGVGPDDADSTPDQAPEAVRAALFDDLNTPAALAALHEAAGTLNKADEKTPQLATALRAGGALLGLLTEAPESWFKRPPAQPRFDGPDAAATQTVDEQWIEEQITARLAARRARDYENADRIRDDLRAHGVLLEDGPDGTIWRWAS